jgi:hypothetical protein
MRITLPRAQLYINLKDVPAAITLAPMSCGSFRTYWIGRDGINPPKFKIINPTPAGAVDAHNPRPPVGNEQFRNSWKRSGNDAELIPGLFRKRCSRGAPPPLADAPTVRGWGVGIKFGTVRFLSWNGFHTRFKTGFIVCLIKTVSSDINDTRINWIRRLLTGTVPESQAAVLIERGLDAFSESSNFSCLIGSV